MSRLQPGLCSVTFRRCSAAEIVELATRAGLRCIEWGGDVHVPHGDLRTAGEVARRTVDAGLEVCSYGSYLVADGAAAGSMGPVLDTAVALGAPAVRVWAPPDGTADSLAEVADAAAELGLWVYLEFHGGTLTSSAPSAVSLLERVDAPNLLCAWQPPYWSPGGEPGALPRTAPGVAAIRMLGEQLAHLHVYAWSGDGTRHPLSRQRRSWTEWIRTAGDLDAPEGFRRSVLIEFVEHDDPANLRRDAAVLREILAVVGDGPVGGTGARPPEALRGGSPGSR